jgi:diketogulonate reductase-like aldo/keto reductase
VLCWFFGHSRDQPEIAKLITNTPRSAYFLTTKIPVHGANVPKVLTAAYALRAVEEDVKELGVKQLDLVLIHHPSNEQSYNQALWKGLEQAVAKNLTRTIGLSNFNQADIEAILKIATIRPVVNQCDLSVGGEDTQCGPRDAAIAYNQAQNITYEAWSPMKKCPFTDPKLMDIAKSHNKTTAQVCLRWILDRGCTIAVGTGSDPAKVAEYTEENLNLFDFSLTAEEVKTINAMGGKIY